MYLIPCERYLSNSSVLLLIPFALQDLNCADFQVFLAGEIPEEHTVIERSEMLAAHVPVLVLFHGNMHLCNTRP